MYILPQFLEIETKKLLKIKLNKIITDITDDFIENLFVVNPDNKYQNIVLNLDKNIKEAALQIIKETIEIEDNLFLSSNERKNYFNVCNKYKRSAIALNIDFKESLALSLALALNNFGLGIGASISGLNIAFTTISTFIISLIFISLGFYLSKTIKSKNISKNSEILQKTVL